MTSLLDMYGRLRAGNKVVNDEAEPLVTLLKLSGIVKEQGRVLEVRNRIYAQVFDKMWVRDNMPCAEIRRQKRANRKGLIRALSPSSVVDAIKRGLAVYGFNTSRNAGTEMGRARNAEDTVLKERAAANRTAYFANMNLIQREWETNNVAHVVDLLEETRPYKDSVFEWGYWNRLCHLDLRTLKGHTDAVTSVVFSPMAGVSSPEVPIIRRRYGTP